MLGIMAVVYFTIMAVIFSLCYFMFGFLLKITSFQTIYENSSEKFKSNFATFSIIIVIFAFMIFRIIIYLSPLSEQIKADESQMLRFFRQIQKPEEKKEKEWKEFLEGQRKLSEKLKKEINNENLNQGKK